MCTIPHSSITHVGYLLSRAFCMNTNDTYHENRLFVAPSVLAYQFNLLRNALISLHLRVFIFLRQISGRFQSFFVRFPTCQQNTSGPDFAFYMLSRVFIFVFHISSKFCGKPSSFRIHVQIFHIVTFS